MSADFNLRRLARRLGWKRWFDSMPSRCEHRDDPTYDGRWCAICNPELGGDRGAAV